MPGISALSRVQVGLESTPGTGVAATAVWRGMGMLQDNTEIVFVPEKIGVLGGTTRSHIPRTGGEITLEGDATFEQSGYIFRSSVKQIATPTTDASSAFIYSYPVQWADTDAISATDLATLSIEAGDNQQAYLGYYGFCPEWALSGAAGEALQWSAKFETRQIATGSFTAGLAAPTVESILFSKGLLYIDPSTDAAGTTLKSNTLLDMNLKFKSGWRSVQAADGRVDFSFIKRVDDEILLDLTFEHDAAATAEYAFWKSQSERVIRLQFNGSALTTTNAGATYDTKALRIDLYGKWQTFSPPEEQDGNNVVKGTFKAAYSSAAANKATFTVANELSVLP